MKPITPTNLTSPKPSHLPFDSNQITKRTVNRKAAPTKPPETDISQPLRTSNNFEMANTPKLPANKTISKESGNIKCLKSISPRIKNNSKIKTAKNQLTAPPDEKADKKPENQTGIQLYQRIRPGDWNLQLRHRF